MSSSLKLLSSSKCFGGVQRIYSHISQVLDCEMKFGVYVPPAALESISTLPPSSSSSPSASSASSASSSFFQLCPVLYYLSGLSSTHENFIENAGAQAFAAHHGMIIVTPDTSPRNVATEMPAQLQRTDHGEGAGFYVDATEEPWCRHYRMFTYVTQELIAVIEHETQLPIAKGKRGICGFSMGGHGALICALRRPELYRSVSVFAPVANPTVTSWGRKMLRGYLGETEGEWPQWDATCLIGAYAGCTPLELFVDQGSCDEYLADQLQTENLLKAAVETKSSAAMGNGFVRIIYKKREGYDHSYLYVRTFIEEHLDYHAALLQ